MAGHQGKQRYYQQATSHLAESKLRRHIAALDLDDITAYRAWCREHGFGVTLRKSKHQLQRELHCARAEQAKRIANRERDRHLSAIGFSRSDEYEQWCDLHRFGADSQKSHHQYAREMVVRRDERAEAALRTVTVRELRPEDLVEAIYYGRVAPEIPDTEVCRRIRRTFALARTMLSTRAALLQLVKRVYSRSRLYATKLHIGPPRPREDAALEQALYQLARRHLDWVRQPETWKPDSRSPRRQFGSLARHLLARYPVPAFMDAAWFEGDGNDAERHRDWFVRLGVGGSVSEFRLPLSLTKRAMHCFLHAPADIGIMAALRWGQVVGLGGSERLARAVIGSDLRGAMTDEPFWTTVIYFFCNQTQLEMHQVAPIVDYLYQRKYVDTIKTEPDGEEIHCGPAEPDLTMKGRSLHALWRRVEEWHAALARENAVKIRAWERSGIEPMEVCRQRFGRDAVDLQWNLEELLSTQELQAEGEAMHNCVATYVEECVSGECAIWSLRVRADNEPASKRVMTLEIDLPARAIVQARGRFNRVPTSGKPDALLKAAPEILRLWAKQQKLAISAFAW